MSSFVIRKSNGRTKTRDCIDSECANVGTGMFSCGLCLPSDNKLTSEEQEQIIEIIRGCFA